MRTQSKATFSPCNVVFFVVVLPGLVVILTVGIKFTLDFKT